MPTRVAVTVEQCWHAVPGGTATSILGLLRALVGRAADTGFGFVGLSARHRRPPASDDLVPPIDVSAAPLPRRLLYSAWHQVGWPTAEQVVGPVDVVHATTSALVPSAAPIVVTVHDLAFRHSPEHFTRRGVRFFEQGWELTRRRAAVVVCPSEATAGDVEAGGIDRDRIRVVPWGTDFAAPPDDDVDPTLARLGVSRPYVLAVGTREPRKNLATLVAAHGRMVSASELVVAGPTGWGEDGLEGVERVRALGFVARADLAALYAGASAFAYPSRREGFGLPVLDAMACGAPVVTSSGTAMAEVLADAGWLVDPDDADALAAVLDEALAGGPGVEARRAAAKARADTFSWARCAAGYEQAYGDATR